MAIQTPSSALTKRRWQDNFLALLPAIRQHAAIVFRHHHDRQEAIAEATASAFISYGVLARHGKLARAFPSSLARFAVHAVIGGRHVGGRLNTRDVMSLQAQRKRGFTVENIGDDQHEAWRDMAQESRRISPADQACFNVDFEAWLLTWPLRHRHIINTLAMGHRTQAVAKHLGISPSRVSQLRRQYEDSWNQFQEVALNPEGTTTAGQR